MITAEEFNDHVAAALRNRPLRGFTDDFGGGDLIHDWKTHVSPDYENPRLWRVLVEPGSVNDRMACISYLRVGDPRGWIMPDNHSQIEEMRKIYGDDFRFVDRRLTERLDPPHLLCLTPDAAGQDLGDFQLVPPDDRPEALRGAAHWEFDCYRTSVFVTAMPLRASRVLDLLGFPVPSKNRRYRVYVGKLPTRVATVLAGGHKELARLWLLRPPGQPLGDILEVEQRCFWSLRQMNAEPSLGGFDPFFRIPGLEIIDLITALILDGVAGDFEAAASGEWWTG